MVEPRRTRPCGDCRGTGEVLDLGRGQYETDFEVPCTACQGSGLLPARRVILRSGVDVDFLNFDNTELREVDLYRGCVRECRYLNSIDVSLLLHLALCAQIARARGHSTRVVAACAAHDLHEVYFRDIPTGLKDLLPDYKALESAAEASVFRRLGLSIVLPEERAQIKHVDEDALLTEATYFKHPGLQWMEEELGRSASASDLRRLRRIVNDEPEELWPRVSRAIRAHTTGGIIWENTTQSARRGA